MVTCFFVRRDRRGEGVATALLAAVDGFVARHGGTLVEGYPVDDGWQGAAAIYTGTLDVRPRGFVEVARPGDRPLVRLELPRRRGVGADARSSGRNVAVTSTRHHRGVVAGAHVVPGPPQPRRRHRRLHRRPAAERGTSAVAVNRRRGPRRRSCAAWPPDATPTGRSRRRRGHGLAPIDREAPDGAELLIAVAEPWRGRGLALAIGRELVALATECGVSRVVLRASYRWSDVRAAGEALGLQSVDLGGGRLAFVRQLDRRSA